MKTLIPYEEHTFSNPHLSKHPVQCAISDCQMTENSKRSRGQLREYTFSLNEQNCVYKIIYLFTVDI